MHTTLKIKRGKRVFIAGRTGSGKTELLLFLLRAQTVPVVVLDTKIENKFLSLPNAVAVNGLDEYAALDFSRFDFQPFLIVRPQPDESDPERLDAFLMHLHETTRNVCIAVDELYSLHTGGRHGPGLQSLLTRGRSRGQTMIMGAQRPSWISLFCLSESDYLCAFALNLRRDRDRLYEMIGDDRLRKKVDNHYFWWYIVGQDRLIGFSPIDISQRPEPPEPPSKRFYFL